MKNPEQIALRARKIPLSPAPENDAGPKRKYAMHFSRALALAALVSAAACAAPPKPEKPAPAMSADYEVRYQQCMYQAWAGPIDWKTRKAMCRAQAASGDGALGAAGPTPAHKPAAADQTGAADSQ
ncbi:MAG: hypothetical protein GC153_01940 [Alphaproteobacteria bacterium]|nr:hypothetical protein [Alphaproteobacteria bacterium]